MGCKLFSSSKKLRGLDVRAQARGICISLPYSVAGTSSFLFPPRSAMLWDRSLDLDSLNLTSRFANRLLLLLRPVVVKKRP